MKLIKNILLLIVLSAFFACTTDEETVIVPKTLEQYKKEMQDFVTSQLNIVNACVVGYNKGDFRSSTNYDAYTAAYRAKLTAAQTELSKTGLTIQDVVKVNTSLATDGKNFQTNLYISDRRPLNDVVVACEALNTATPEGTAQGQVPAAAKLAFTNAIAAAKVVRNATTTVERQVTEEVGKLNSAKKAFEDAIVK
ncbi:MAG: hypothetical protein RBT57_07525 [Paludibacter sp.]|jgi:hypothetical protein|nr:hypothetical protein [Paludibacter sp.]